MSRGSFSLSFVCVFAVMLSLADVASAGQCYLNTSRPMFGVPINVSLELNNQLQAPYFKNRTTRTQLPQTWLVNFLNAAVDVNVAFNNYTATYSKLGYFISAINNVTGTTAKRTYWSIVDARTGHFLPCGVSSFVPDNNDVILFNFTTY